MPVTKASKPPRFEVDLISFNLKLIKAYIPIKFKCRFLVEIKTSSTTSALKTLAKSKDHYRQTASLITFDKNQDLPFTQYMVFENEIKRYKKTQIQIVVSLISDNRGDEIKLVGRIRADLNEFMIDNKGETLLKEQELENCSVKKPEVAKLIYELSLVKEEKMNIAQNPDRQTIYAQIDRGVFSDALEYNQFGKQVFGKDFSLVNASKLSKSLNDSMNKGNQRLREDIEPEKAQKAEAKSINEIAHSSIKQIEDKNSSIVQPNQKKFLDSSKKIETFGQNKLQQGDKKVVSKAEKAKYTNTEEKIQPQAKNDSIDREKPELSNSPKDKPFQISNRPSWIKSPSKYLNESPRQKSKHTQPVSQQITQIQPSSQPKQRSNLTQSMFDQQQMVIESLQQQLQQANQMIEQYRLEMELLKEETERLEHEKSMHASEMETSRVRNKSISNNFMMQLSSPQQQQLQHQVHKLTLQVQEYKKVFTQKQQIIEQKDLLISSLQKQIQSAAIDMIELQNQKDSSYTQLNDELTLVLHENHQMKVEINKLMEQIAKKTEDSQNMETFIQQLKKEVDGLENMLRNSGLNELNAKLTQKNQQIQEIQDLLSLQKINTTELQLRISSLDSTITALTKSLSEQTQKLAKLQQILKKQHQAKQKAELEVSKAVEKAKTIQKQKYQLQQQITDQKANQKSLQKLVDQKVKQYKHQYDDLILTYEEAQNKIAELKFAVQSYQSTLQLQQAKSQEQIRELTIKLQNFNKKEHLLRQSLDLLENQTTKIRNFVEEKEIKLREYEELVIMKDEELSEKNDKLNFLERKHRMTENAINDLKLQLKMANAMNLQAQDDRPAGSEEQLETRLFILNNANMQLLEKQKYLTETIDQKEQAIHELQKLTALIDPLKRQIASLEQKLSSAEQKCLQLKEEMKNLSKRELQQKAKMDQQSSELQHTFIRCQQLQERLNQLQEKKLMVQKEKIQKLELQVRRKNEDLTSIKRQLGEVERANQELNKKLTFMEGSNVTENPKIQDTLAQSRKIIQDKESISAIKQFNSKGLHSPHQYTRSREEQEIYRLTEELQTYKQRQESYMCNVLDLQEQLQIVKREKLTLSSSISEQRQSIRKSQCLQPTTLYDKKDLKVACDQLEKLIEQRIKNRETENLIQMIVSNSEILGSESRTTNEEGTIFTRQKNSLQEKSRILSREVQKIKSIIFKNSEFSYKSKTQIIQLLKPCENITNQLVKITENFVKENDEEIFSEA